MNRRGVTPRFLKGFRMRGSATIDTDFKVMVTGMAPKSAVGGPQPGLKRTLPLQNLSELVVLCVRLFVPNFRQPGYAAPFAPVSQCSPVSNGALPHPRCCTSLLYCRSDRL
jgi:hypothetical protein